MTPGWGLGALAALFAPAAADAPAASPLEMWYGEWSGAGTAFGKPATATLAIGPTPEGGTTALAYRLSVEGTPPMNYSAEATYRVDAKGRVTGTWTDSHGRTRPIGGRVSAHDWTNNWGSADVEIGRSTYRLETPGRLVVSDSVIEDDGSWRIFSTLHFRRNKR